MLTTTTTSASLSFSVYTCVCVYLWWPFWNRFIAQGLQRLHGSAVSCCLAGASLADELMTPHRQLHIKDLRNRIMVPGVNTTTDREKGIFIIKEKTVYLDNKKANGD